MDDERIERALRLGPVDEPVYQRRESWGPAADADGLADGPSLRAASAQSSAGTSGLERLRPVGVGFREAGRPRRRSFPATIAAAIAVIVGTLLVAQAIPSGPAATPEPSADLLSRLRSAGLVEVAVTNGAPQTLSQGGAYLGFDVDVAKAVVEQLGLSANVSARAPSAFASSSWDLALPGHALLSPDLGAASQPYAFWPVWLAAPEGSPLTGIGSLAGARVCVVGGSAGEDWLAGGNAGAPVAAPSGTAAVVASSDAECLAAVSEGRADALLTAALFSDEVESRGLGLVVQTAVVSDAWAIVVRGQSGDYASMLAAVNEAITTLRSSGRLAELSAADFGGRDVTVPQP